MIKQFITQNRIVGGGKPFQYKTINVIVDDFGGQRSSGHEGTLSVTPNTWKAKMCLITQNGGAISEKLSLDEGTYSDLLPVSYSPQVYTGHQSWGQNANYYLEKEKGDSILIKPELTYFTFTAICGIIEVDVIRVLEMDNIGRVNVIIRNIDTNERERHTEVNCQLKLNMSSSWEFVTAVSLPKWRNIEVHFETFSTEMRI